MSPRDARAILLTMTRALVNVMAAAGMILVTAGSAAADVETAQRASVLGTAEIHTHDPHSVFEFSVHAWGDGRSGTGAVWLSHHDDEQIGWLVARVDCVRVTGSLGVVTAVVSDAQDFSGAAPGDPIALAVRDHDTNGTRDSLRFAAREQAEKCHTPETTEHEISRGDFRVGH